jgi:hypothetical protein
MIGFELSAKVSYTGYVAVPAVALFPFPLLSAHASTLLPDKVSVDESAASSHIARPDIPEFAGVRFVGPNLENTSVPVLLSVFPLISTVWIAG